MDAASLHENMVEPFHIYTKAEKLNALKPMSAFTFTPKPKPNAEVETWIFYFLFERPNSSKYERFVTSNTQYNFDYTCTYTHTHELYII